MKIHETTDAAAEGLSFQKPGPDTAAVLSPSRMHLGRIIVYPIKSLDGVSVREARITPGGILEHDRVYALVDENGKYVNAKRFAEIHRLRCTYDSGFQEVYIGVGEASAQRFVLAEPGPLNRWISDYFGFRVQLVSEFGSGFPDDREAFGPTIVAESSLAEVAGWYPGLTTENARLRFRANLEINGEDAVAFCEDRLYGAPGALHPFRVGDVHFLGHNPCQRCAVPTRDQRDGTVWKDFQKIFMEQRRLRLPPWAEVARFNHYYRFTINTSIPPSEAGKILHPGDCIDMGDAAPAGSRHQS